ncbi:MAG TPA: HAD hydrolase-like protein [Chlamydiales bacterium]|jgi:putative hydrolase of the HAD superfamily|nr:HAD hydrolase-like protein [Chlamydiales bacterium]
MAKNNTPITHLFLDIGGVLLTNGWDHNSRARACKQFKLERTDIEARHQLNFELFDAGKLSLKEYLARVIFYKERPFTYDQFRQFMLEQSKPYPKMIQLMTELKTKHGLKIAAVSNEARELNAYRIATFKLDHLIDSFISSCFVHIRKPDTEMFQLALDISQAKVSQVLYIENTSLFVELAERMGIQSILHTDYTSTCQKLASLGLLYRYK